MCISSCSTGPKDATLTVCRHNIKNLNSAPDWIFGLATSQQFGRLRTAAFINYSQMTIYEGKNSQSDNRSISIASVICQVLWFISYAISIKIRLHFVWSSRQSLLIPVPSNVYCIIHHHHSSSSFIINLETASFLVIMLLYGNNDQNIRKHTKMLDSSCGSP